MTVSEDINTLIPQRDPIQMVDRLESVDGKKGFTSLSIKAGNFFIDDDGLIAEAGLIEHIAQSASAFGRLYGSTERCHRTTGRLHWRGQPFHMSLQAGCWNNTAHRC